MKATNEHTILRQRCDEVLAMIDEVLGCQMDERPTLRDRRAAVARRVTSAAVVSAFPAR